MTSAQKKFLKNNPNYQPKDKDMKSKNVTSHTDWNIDVKPIISGFIKISTNPVVWAVEGDYSTAAAFKKLLNKAPNEAVREQVRNSIFEATHSKEVWDLATAGKVGFTRAHIRNTNGEMVANWITFSGKDFVSMHPSTTPMVQDTDLVVLDIQLF